MSEHVYAYANEAVCEEVQKQLAAHNKALLKFKHAGKKYEVTVVAAKEPDEAVATASKRIALGTMAAFAEREEIDDTSNAK